MEKIELKTAWQAVRKRDCYIPPHSHDYYELVYYCQGQGNTWIDGKPYFYTGGQFVLLSPGAVHDETHQTDCNLFCIGFLPDRKLPADLYKDQQGTVFQIVTAIFQESTNQEIGYHEMISARLTELAVVIQRLAAKQPQRPTAKSFSYVIHYILENYHEKIQLKGLAQQLHFSYDYFQHRFKALLGVSPQQFLIRRRVEAACTMLRQSQLSCTEIAYRCGFSNSAQFSAIFKRECGVSPAQYRRTQENRLCSFKLE